MDGTPTPAKLVIVSGRSGSGKSTALHVLEDAGFYCIDNLPALLLPELIEQARESDGITNKRMAVSIDARNMAGHLSRFGDILRMLPQDLPTEVIYLDADDATLIRRFSETRRKHPLSNRNTSLNEAIAAERMLLAAIAERAALTIDTSALSPHDLRELVGRTVAVETDGSMVILFESFGFKRGIPIYADMVFDLRCLPNPHWNPALRRLSGLDEDVAKFLHEQPEVGEMLADITAYLDRWLPRFARSSRSYVTVALGCTGGQHRSVYMCEQLERHFRDLFPGVQVRHRDLAGNRQN
ncbi:MAG: RNase adapter RapZ [Gammaproteobacteria bacterium]|nr:RNase adapter RapZ [Gammaproteobacteria bacterium]